MATEQTFTVKVKVRRVDGPAVDDEDVEATLHDEIGTLEFDAGDESSVFKVEEVEAG